LGKIIPFKKVTVRKRKPPQRLSPDLLWDILRHHMQCPMDQRGKCALTLFAQQACWELNQAMNLPDPESEGFRRCDEMLAAKPLNESHGAMPVKTVYPNRDEMCAARPISEHDIERALEGRRLADSMNEE
jgi:hypothetical protein